MAITYDNVISGLADAVPEFHPDDDDVSDNLVYLVFSDLMRFIRSLSEEPGRGDVLERIFDFIERAIRDSDPRVVDVMRDTFVELATMPNPAIAKKYTGRATRKLLRHIERTL